ncbi:MAG: deoxyribose-phosphate aldolase [Phycisphaerales bacterium]|nr:MAG: deoxyribose-phosphate aldolase [Phycisphaerales bacterium]
MKLTVRELARLMDLSAVRTDVDIEEIHRLAEEAKKYSCICAFPMPCYLPELKELLADAPEVGVGGVVGFPSGAHSTATKVAEARQQLEQGAVELDMVINVGMLRSGRDRDVEEDIRAVVEAADGTPVKVILEVHYLSGEEIVHGCRLAVRAGAAFVKTGTGWAPTGATLENVALMKSAVGDAALVKAAGGVRDLATVVAMIRRGVSRFGVGLSSGVKILEECVALPDGAVEV